MSAEKSNAENAIWHKLERGRKAKAALGGYAGYGSPAFGQKAVDGELVTNSQEQEIIELIRRHHKSGKSLQQIADWLNGNGYKTKRGQQWRRISIKRVLDRLYGKTDHTSDIPQSPSNGTT
ncbi:recombinase family protein [Waterburya agarophytonicola K14]|uniref:Recombinase family protein n=1 Tax=Waterburya agarophytonicola KI4 TaxID=2874699 RepID=A0A964BN00_9CYAN|nr:recombinase family protein [Waterburya agarophytonicola]MCC0176280.1 recombinase family protein [Waterburya agarophytonicola KI4]